MGLPNKRDGEGQKKYENYMLTLRKHANAIKLHCQNMWKKLICS